ncbi:MAG: triose-phosphate isomerase [Chloroflexi bacterium RBG_13_56_8b]|nr:MAG: triose-phosphate isomerase [Chloroflexi bacterium RBG_13_56_8b]
MRVPMIAGNWKMHTTVGEATELVGKMRFELDQIDNIEKVICPPFVSLAAIKEMIKGSTIKLGAQDLHYEEKGAFTGEISPQMVADLCDYVIVGHSERRHYFNETIDIVDKKVKAALKMGLKPILCIGETPEENKAGKTEEVLTRQLSSPSVRLYLLGGMVIAYEPIWAIGTGRPATGEQANKTIGFIRQYVAEEQGKGIAQDVRILYGGSVTAENIAEFVKQPEIDGALVGGASLKASEFLAIVKQTAEIKEAK